LEHLGEKAANKLVGEARTVSQRGNESLIFYSTSDWRKHYLTIQAGGNHVPFGSARETTTKKMRRKERES